MRRNFLIHCGICNHLLCFCVDCSGLSCSMSLVYFYFTRTWNPTFIVLGEQVELEGQGFASAFISTRKNIS